MTTRKASRPCNPPIEIPSEATGRFLAKHGFKNPAGTQELLWNGMAFTFRADGYFNMTKAAQQFGKEVREFMRLPSTLEYIDALSNVGISHVSTSRRGNGGGTWGHPKLAVFFARWLNVRFSVWCDAIIEDILKGHAELTITAPLDSAVLEYEARIKALELTIDKLLSAPPKGPELERKVVTMDDVPKHYKTTRGAIKELTGRFPGLPGRASASRNFHGID